jgi:hypothetical protein
MAIGAVPVFMDIDDVDAVYRLVAELRDKAGAARANRWREERSGQAP